MRGADAEYVHRRRVRSGQERARLEALEGTSDEIGFTGVQVGEFWEDREELLRLRIGLAAEDIEEQNKAYSKIYGIHWMPDAQVDADKIIYDYKRELSEERLRGLEQLEKSIRTQGGHVPLHGRSGTWKSVFVIFCWCLLAYVMFFAE